MNKIMPFLARFSHFGNVLLFHINAMQEHNTHRLRAHNQFGRSFLPSLHRHIFRVLFWRIWSVAGDLHLSSQVYHLTSCLLNLWKGMLHQWKCWWQLSNLSHTSAIFTMYSLPSQYSWSLIFLGSLHFRLSSSFFHKIYERFVFRARIWNSCQKICI